LTGAAPAEDAPQPSGFRGWLLLLAIIVCLGPVRSIVNVIMAIGDVRAALQLPNAKFVLAYGAAMDIAYFTLQIVVIVVMLRRRSTFVRWFTGLWLATLFLPAVDLLVLMAAVKVPPAWIFDASQLRPFLVGVSMSLWVWYVHVSVRVKNTFTN
jgi:hypothetical protein